MLPVSTAVTSGEAWYVIVPDSASTGVISRSSGRCPRCIGRRRGPAYARAPAMANVVLPMPGCPVMRGEREVAFIDHEPAGQQLFQEFPDCRSTPGPSSSVGPGAA